MAVVCLLVAGVLGFVLHVEMKWDRRYDIAGPDLHASKDPEIIARGEYIVRGPAHCTDCHISDFNEILRSDRGEVLPLSGGATFDLPPLGTMQSPNLTPDRTGLGSHEDRLVFRMLRHSVKSDGTASLWPMMPFFMMADDDLVAIVSYLRSLEPVANTIAPPRYSFIGKAMRTFADVFEPRIGHTPPKTAPPEAPTRERGEYLARSVSNCATCHTRVDLTTARFVGPEFAGGYEEPSALPSEEPKLWYRSPNITPDPNGVLAAFDSKEAWIHRFRVGRVFKGSPMPWGPFSRMSDTDLEAVWIFLKSLPPTANDLGPTIFEKE
jgi:mono/diheme cytochrome c family protein